jgi:hypothetical protein
MVKFISATIKSFEADLTTWEMVENSKTARTRSPEKA